jgi:integrase/recombinase XerD
VNRHVCILNPAAAVKGVKEQVIEGKTPEITIEQARSLLASVDTGHVVGLRDRAILATLAYTACRAGAVAKLRLQDFQHDGQQYVLRFQEKGGKSREIPVRHDLEGFILAYVEEAGIAGEAKDSPLFRASNGRSRKLAAKPLGTERICELVKRRLKDAGLPSRLSPHSFRVTAITSLLEQGVPMEDVQ